MDDPRKHDSNKRKNSKITPAAINIGAGSFGMGGIVLVGAGLVTATLVSALAFKTRRRRRSSSENRNSRSPSPETPTVHAPNQLESMIKTSKDFSADSLPLNLPNSSDEVTGMKEIQTKNIQNLTLDKKHNSGIDADEQVGSGDTNEDVIFSVVGEDQKNTLICVDLVSQKLDNANEVVVLEYEEEKAVMAVNNESGPPTSEEDSSSEIIERDDGDEQQIYSMLTDNENKEQDDKKLLISNEVVASIEEEDDEEEIPTGHVGEGQEKVFMNEEAACVNKIKEAENFLEENQEDGHDEIVLENSEIELIEEVSYADQIVDELVIQEEVIDAACVHQMEVEKDSQVQFVQEEKGNDQQMQYDSEQEEGTKAALDNILEINDHEVALHTHEMHLNDSLKVSVDDQAAVKEDNPPTNLINEDERCKETEEMITENELVKKDEIPKVLENNDGDLIDETGYADQVVGELVVEEEAIDAAFVHQIEEQDGPQVQFVEDEKENDQEIQHDNEQIMVEEAITAACVDSDTVGDIMEATDHEVSLDAQKMHLNVFVGVKEDYPPTQLMNKEGHKKDEDELVMKDETPHVQSIEDDESRVSELSSDELEDSSEKATISDHEIQENKEEKQTIVSKNQNDSEHNGIIKEDKVSESAPRGLELEFSKGKIQALAGEPWNLKLLTWSMVISIWCLCHWYFELAFPEVSVAGGILFILIFLCYQNRSTYKYA